MPHTEAPGRSPSGPSAAYVLCSDPSEFQIEDYDALSRRLGVALLRQRLHEQAHHEAGASHQESLFQWLESWIDVDALVARVVRFAGCWRWGHRNYQAIRIVENVLHHRRVPAALDGLRILQLSDIHLDLDPGFARIVVDKLRGLRYDLVVITGDFRNTTTGDHRASAREMLGILPAFDAPVYGILGNHDFVEIVPPLERSGLRFLLNEVVPIAHNGATLYLAGVDDVHFYRTHDLARVREAVPEEAFSILLCHSPEAYVQVAAHGFDVMLSGHTHGGQICLPGGFILVRVCPAPRGMSRGAWEFRGVVGYTSVGTGACGVPLRFFCPPEITIHTLRASDS